MTRKDFVALAGALQRVRPSDYPETSVTLDIARDQWQRDVATVADILEWDNPRFDRERFLRACNGQSQEVTQ
jgi:hypothetical protein